jgi:hypothetical protein
VLRRATDLIDDHPTTYLRDAITILEGGMARTAELRSGSSRAARSGTAPRRVEVDLVGDGKAPRVRQSSSGRLHERHRQQPGAAVIILDGDLARAEVGGGARHRGSRIVEATRRSPPG